MFTQQYYSKKLYSNYNATFFFISIYLFSIYLFIWHTPSIEHHMPWWAVPFSIAIGNNLFEGYTVFSVRFWNKSFVLHKQEKFLKKKQVHFRVNHTIFLLLHFTIGINSRSKVFASLRTGSFLKSKTSFEMPMEVL